MSGLQQWTVSVVQLSSCNVLLGMALVGGERFATVGELVWRYVVVVVVCSTVVG